MTYKIRFDAVLKSCKKYFLPLLQGLFLSGCSGGRSTGHIPAVDHFNARDYMGIWYEIARIPNSFEKGMTHVKAQYFPGKDGNILIINSGLKNGKAKRINGFARFAGDPSTGELEVSFFRPFYSPYRIILLEKDYSAAVVCGASDHYLWILCRKPEISDRKKQEYIQWLRQQGLPAERLEFTAQN